MSRVAIIAVNYKDYAVKFLPEFLATLKNQSFTDYHLYLIDNAASPETDAYLKQNAPTATIIPRPDGNYTAANNAGIKQGLADGSELFVIVNLDVIFTPTWLEELVIAIDSAPEVGIAQSLILLAPQNEAEQQDPLINSIGNKLHYLGFGFTDGYKEKSSFLCPKLTDKQEIKGYASGCSFIIKRAVLEQIGGYEEFFYMYHDDIELSCKAKIAGFSSILAKKSIIYHKYEFARSVRMLYYLERNRLIWVLSFYRIPNLILIFPALLFMELGMWGYALKNGWFRVKINVATYFLSRQGRQDISKLRKKINALRRNSTTSFTNNLEGKILFQEINNPILRHLANPILNCYWHLIKKIIRK